jgi:dTDP-4-dehydrorhamnose 3,5-epimerase
MFWEGYRKSAFLDAGITCEFVQDNFSSSKKGVLRGMHFQRSPGQVKLVSCIRGTIWDVAVDMRPDSSTFGKWEAVELSSDTMQQLLIPIGCAHGFCTMSDEAQVVYKVSAPYDPKEERGFAWDDPEVGISWPITSPILSDRDKSNPRFKEVVGC